MMIYEHTTTLTIILHRIALGQNSILLSDYFILKSIVFKVCEHGYMNMICVLVHVDDFPKINVEISLYQNILHFNIQKKMTTPLTVSNAPKSQDGIHVDLF